MVSDEVMHARALSDVTSAFAAFRPPRRVSVVEGASESLVIKQPGGYTGPWSLDETPYMAEPMNALASRKHDAVCFVGPARTGKTMGLLDGWMAHCVVNDPGDMLMVQMTREKAREYSLTRVDRAIRHSPKLRDLLGRSQHDDNTHDKRFRHGMWLRVGWPTVSQMSSSDYRYVGITEYDRMPDDIDGEGAAFELALKRIQTFLSRGMCMVESSPGRPMEDPNWKPATPHEAPPATGILGIYNRSDRRRLYWRCFDCRQWFEAAPGMALFRLPDFEELAEMVREADLGALATDYNRIVCPHCHAEIGPRAKHDLNRRAVWVPEGQRVVGNGDLEGTPAQSTIAGFWLGGVAAAYQSWRSLLMRYFQGIREYALTGSELSLQTTTNTDQGMPYLSRLLAAAASRGGPEDRKDGALERYVVPDETRFLVASVDVQGGTNARFVVQVHAVGPHLEQWLVDRFEIKDSAREGLGGAAPIDPARYEEDWDQITERVIRATYRTTVDGLELRVRMTVVDTGGEEGVTEKAYAWWRRLRREKLTSRAMLVKGASTKNAPLVRETMVGGRGPKETGDIPLFQVNTNLLKDAVSTGLKREVPGPGYLHLPAWLPKSFFDELQAEVRRPDGTWIQIRKRNEALDLSCYIRAGILRLGADKFGKDWLRVPAWALPLHENSERMTRDERREMKANERIASAPTESAAAQVAPRRRRRVAHSAYLG